MTSMRQRSRPGLGWAYGQALGQTGALNLLFLALFLVGQPLALLIIGKGFIDVFEIGRASCRERV